MEVTQPDPGPNENEATYRQSFLRLPITWNSSAWVFRKNGVLPLAMMNYREMEIDTIQSPLNAARPDW